MCRAVGGKSRMTRDARSLESIAPRHHGWTRVADAPITASLRGCAFRPVTGSGILFFSLPLTGRDAPAGTYCTLLLSLLPFPGV